jgi:hypothetical protein
MFGSAAEYANDTFGQDLSDNSRHADAVDDTVGFESDGIIAQNSDEEVEEQGSLAEREVDLEQENGWEPPRPHEPDLATSQRSTEPDLHPEMDIDDTSSQRDRQVHVHLSDSTVIVKYSARHPNRRPGSIV